MKMAGSKVSKYNCGKEDDKYDNTEENTTDS